MFRLSNFESNCSSQNYLSNGMPRYKFCEESRSGSNFDEAKAVNSPVLFPNIQPFW